MKSVLLTSFEPKIWWGPHSVHIAAQKAIIAKDSKKNFINEWKEWSSVVQKSSAGPYVPDFNQIRPVKHGIAKRKHHSQFVIFVFFLEKREKKKEGDYWWRPRWWLLMLPIIIVWWCSLPADSAWRTHMDQSQPLVSIWHLKNQEKLVSVMPSMLKRDNTKFHHFEFTHAVCLWCPYYSAFFVCLFWISLTHLLPTSWIMNG